MALATPALASAQATASPYTSATRYDALGRVVGTIAPDPDGAGPLHHAATRTTYDLTGRPVLVETGELSAWKAEAVLPANWTGFTVLSSLATTFDALDRKLTETTKGFDGVPTALTQYSYDAAGRLQCTAVRMNPARYTSLPASACTMGVAGTFGQDRITRTTYDAAGQVLTVESAVGTAIAETTATYTYTPNGQRASLTDARGFTAGLYYDGHDRLSGWALPSATPGQPSTTDYESYAYDANGNRTAFRKRDGSVLTYRYDALDRMTVKIPPVRADLAATHRRSVYYGYDLRGLQTYARFSSTAGEGIINTWDGFGRLTGQSSTMGGQSRTITHDYDRNGNIAAVRHADGAFWRYDRDGLGRLQQIAENGAAGVVSAVYDARGGVSAFYRIGVGSTRSYDPAGRLASYSYGFSTAAGDGFTTSFGYNPASQIASQTRDNDLYAWTGHVNVDRDYATNQLNQYTAAGAANFTYDGNGNLTSDGTTSFLYDIENRLVQASGARTAALTYDPLGRLWQTSGGTAGVTRFLYDGDQLVSEWTSAGVQLRRYVHGDGDDDPMLWYEYTAANQNGGVTRALVADHQGSIVAVGSTEGGYAIARKEVAREI